MIPEGLIKKELGQLLKDRAVLKHRCSYRLKNSVFSALSLLVVFLAAIIVIEIVMRSNMVKKNNRDKSVIVSIEKKRIQKPVEMPEKKIQNIRETIRLEKPVVRAGLACSSRVRQRH